MVTGRVAELEAVPKAVTIALPMFAMNLGEKYLWLVNTTWGNIIDKIPPERQRSGDQAKENWKNKAAVDEEAEKNGEEVEAEFRKFSSNVLIFVFVFAFVFDICVCICLRYLWDRRNRQERRNRQILHQRPDICNCLWYACERRDRQILQQRPDNFELMSSLCVQNLLLTTELFLPPSPSFVLFFNTYFWKQTSGWQWWWWWNQWWWWRQWWWWQKRCDDDHLHLEDLTGDKETNSNWGEMYNPGGHLDRFFFLQILTLQFQDYPQLSRLLSPRRNQDCKGFG